MEASSGLGPHAGFIIAAYLVSALIVGGLILRAVLDGRAQARALAASEARGSARRTGGSAPPEGFLATDGSFDA